jgi:hypothetical protein
MPSAPTNVLVVYTMKGQLLTNSGPNAWEWVYWDVQNTPDYTGAQSGYVGQLQNIAIASQANISSPTSGAVTPTSAAGGDLGGNYPNPTVVGIQNQPVSAMAPTTSQVLVFNGTDYAPASLAGLPSGTGAVVVASGVGSAAGGAAGLVLTSNGPSSAPTFQAPPAAAIVQPYASITSYPASANSGRYFQSTDGVTRFLSDGTIWRPDTGGLLGTPPPTVASNVWTQYNASGRATSLTDDHGNVVLSCTNAASGEDARLAVMAIPTPSSPWTWTMCYALTAPLSTGDAHQCGLCTRYSGNGYVESWTDRVDTSGDLWYTQHRSTANNTTTSPTYTFSSENKTAVGSQSSTSLIWQRINFDGTNRNQYYSVNGLDWVLLYSMSNTTFFGANPDEVGIEIFSSSSTSELLSCRVVSAKLTQP